MNHTRGEKTAFLLSPLVLMHVYFHVATNHDDTIISRNAATDGLKATATFAFVTFPFVSDCVPCGRKAVLEVVDVGVGVGVGVGDGDGDGDDDGDGDGGVCAGGDDEPHFGGFEATTAAALDGLHVPEGASANLPNSALHLGLGGGLEATVSTV